MALNVPHEKGLARQETAVLTFDETMAGRLTVPDRILCIYCGRRADIIETAGTSRFACCRCQKTMALDSYRKLLSDWLDDVVG